MSERLSKAGTQDRGPSQFHPKVGGWVDGWKGRKEDEEEESEHIPEKMSN